MSATTRYNWRFEVDSAEESHRYYYDEYFVWTSDEADREATRCEDFFVEDTGLEIVRVVMERCGEVSKERRP